MRLIAAYYDINDKYNVEIIIWTLQLFINGYFYHKYLQSQISKFQKKIRCTIYFYFIALVITILLSIAVKILKIFEHVDIKVIHIAIRTLDIIKYPMLNLVDIVLIDFGLKLIIVEAQVFVHAKSTDQVMKRYERAHFLQRSLIAAFVIFLVFYDMTNIFNMLKW